MASKRIRSKQHARRRKEARRRRLTMYLGIGVLLVILLLGLTHWKKIQIETVNVTTSSHISSNLVYDLTESILAEPLLGLISRNNILLLPRTQIQHKVQGISPRIKAANVSIDGLRAIKLEVIDRETVAHACQPARESEPSDCQLVDESGFIFADANTATSSSSTLTYIINSELNQGTQLLPVHRFRSLNLFVDTLAEAGMRADQIRVGEYGDVIIPAYPAEASRESEDSVDLKVNFYDDLSRVVSNLQTVVENESFVTNTPTDGETPESISPFSLEYIDLRFENKIFYK